MEHSAVHVADGADSPSPVIHTASTAASPSMRRSTPAGLFTQPNDAGYEPKTWIVLRSADTVTARHRTATRGGPDAELSAGDAPASQPAPPTPSARRRTPATTRRAHPNRHRATSVPGELGTSADCPLGARNARHYRAQIIPSALPPTAGCTARVGCVRSHRAPVASATRQAPDSGNLFRFSRTVRLGVRGWLARLPSW